MSRLLKKSPYSSHLISSHSSWFDNPNYISGRLPIMRLLSKQFSPFFSCFTPLRCNYCLQHPRLKLHQFGALFESRPYPAVSPLGVFSISTQMSIYWVTLHQDGFPKLRTILYPLAFRNLILYTVSCVERRKQSTNSKSYHVSVSLSIPVAAQSKVWVCGLSLAGIVGSKPAWRMDVCLL